MSQVISSESAMPVQRDPCVIGDDGEDSVPVLVPERFVINDAQKASWAVRKILEARTYAARVRQWSERELSRAENDEQWLLRRFGAELEAWLRGELECGGCRRRSINLPGGLLGLRAQPARLQVVDEQILLAWCRAQLPEALKATVEARGTQAVELLKWQREHADECRVQEHVLREPLARHLTQSGEVPDGAVVRPAADQLYVR